MSEELILTTLDTVPGYRVSRVLGLVTGIAEVRREVRSPLPSTALPGSEVIEDLLEEALDDLCEKARDLGANAVVGVRICVSELTAVAGAVVDVVVVYGTAVVLEPEKRDLSSSTSSLT